MSIAATIDEQPTQTPALDAVADEQHSPTIRQESPVKIAYLMSRFPKLTETFVLFEMLAIERQGARVEALPLLRARNSNTHPEGAGVWKKFVELFRRPETSAVMHPEAEAYVARAHFASLFDWAIALAHLHYLLRKPAAYLGALWTLVRANLGSANYLLGGLALFPKTVYFAREMSRLEIAHIHAHFANHPAAAAYVIHRLTGIPFSFTAHGADLQVDQHMLREKVAAAKHVITISRHNQQFIEEVCGEAAVGRVRIVRCGVDTRVFGNAQREIPNEKTTPLKIVCTGTLYEVKGHRYLIEACHLLSDQGVPFHCQLVGDGPLLDELQQQVDASGLSQAVVFLGRRTRQEIADLLQQADVVVAPSVPTAEGRREGIPVVLMEAMASGLPVISSNMSGIPELVEHEQTGLLTRPGDAHALADALLRLAHDAEARARLGNAARTKILEEFDLDTNASRLLDYFTAEAP